MIVIEHTDTCGWDSAVRGMRNPLNSWDKSDSCMTATAIDEGWGWLGENDLSLMQRLIKAGPDHSKFMRMIIVYCDITAPLYWWKEHDTYKVGTVANSCSTMHKIHAKPFTMGDFSTEHLTPVCVDHLNNTIGILNLYRTLFIESGAKSHWWQMIQLLPSSYNQKRTVELNYAVLRNMYHARKNHKLDEWHDFCEWVESLPYAKELILS